MEFISTKAVPLTLVRRITLSTRRSHWSGEILSPLEVETVGRQRTKTDSQPVHRARHACSETRCKGRDTLNTDILHRKDARTDRAGQPSKHRFQLLHLDETILAPPNISSRREGRSGERARVYKTQRPRTKQGTGTNSRLKLKLNKTSEKKGNKMSKLELSTPTTQRFSNAAPHPAQSEERITRGRTVV